MLLLLPPALLLLPKLPPPPVTDERALAMSRPAERPAEEEGGVGTSCNGSSDCECQCQGEGGELKPLPRCSKAPPAVRAEVAVAVEEGETLVVAKARLVVAGAEEATEEAEAAGCCMAEK